MSSKKSAKDHSKPTHAGGRGIRFYWKAGLSGFYTTTVSVFGSTYCRTGNFCDRKFLRIWVIDILRAGNLAFLS